MLSLATRIGCAAVFLCLLACENSPAPPPKHTSSDTRSDEADGGSAEQDDRDAGDDQKVTTGAAGKSADKPASSPAKPAAGTGGAGGHAAGKGGSDTKGEAGVGGEPRVNGEAGRGGEGGTPADDTHAGEGGDDDDIGNAGAAAPSGNPPVGGAASTQDAIAVLWQLLGQTPQGMAADVIRKYLEALGSGDTPASSIEDFLRAIDDQAHCTQGISQQCLAACQVVARSCGVCLIDENCRNELVQVCGVLSCR
jgi:hypothetical protein